MYVCSQYSHICIKLYACATDCLPVFSKYLHVCCFYQTLIKMPNVFSNRISTCTCMCGVVTYVYLIVKMWRDNINVSTCKYGLSVSSKNHINIASFVNKSKSKGHKTNTNTNTNTYQLFSLFISYPRVCSHNWLGFLFHFIFIQFFFSFF